MSLINDYLKQYSYSYLLEQALARVPDNLDKRQGSIIYDAIAPACYELAVWYVKLREIIDNTFIETAYGEWLDARVVEAGITRYPATYAVKKGTFLDNLGNPVSVYIGARFSTMGQDTILNYKVDSAYIDPDTNEIELGSYNLTCETAGVVGNSYFGQIQPIDFIPSLVNAALTTLVTPAQDAEDDDSLRTRFLSSVGKSIFGGNISQYKQWVIEEEGVGAAQIYPVWNGGGTVKISIVDSEYNKVSDDFLKQVKEHMDPENADIKDSGQMGLGIVPIGHNLTVVTPSEVVVNIVAVVTLLSGYTVSLLQAKLEEKIEEYFLKLREEWAVSDNWNRYAVTVYVARVNYAILSVDGVSSVYDTTLNGEARDVELVETEITQQIPILGTVTINARSSS